MSTMDNEDVHADIENRAIGLRRIKQDDTQNRSNLPQASRRPALGILPLNNVRIQPSRNAKQPSISCQDENVVPGAANGKTYLPKVPSFSVFSEASLEEEDVTKPNWKNNNLRINPPSQLQVHSGVIELQRQPLAPLSVPEIFNEDDCDSNAGSPMVLDESHDGQKLQDNYDREKLSIPEYSQDIYRYLREAELRYRPKPHYLRKQPDITAGMRSILVDWLVEVGEEYKLQTETLHLAVSYIDRFLSCMSVLRGKLQLVGTACMFIAAKYEEIYPPDVGEFVYITDDTYTKKQVLRMEHLVLKVLSFDLAVPTPYYFLERYCKIERAGEVVEYLAMYLVELTLLEAEPYLKYLPSVVAGSAVCLANVVAGREMWNEDLRYLTGYSVSDFRECLDDLHKTAKSASDHPQQAVREKYRSHKLLRVAEMPVPDMLQF